MEQDRHLHDATPALPSSFFEALVSDIPASAWAALFQSNPTLKEMVLEGFSIRPNKMENLMRQSHVRLRLQRILKTHPELFEEVLRMWGYERLSIVAFIEMLDRSFVTENWDSLKNLLTPERFYAAIRLLGFFEEKEIQSRIEESFWNRSVDPEVVIPLMPVLDVYRELLRQFPEAGFWTSDSKPAIAVELPARRDDEAVEGRDSDSSRRSDHKLKKALQKLEKALAEQEHLQEGNARYRKENEELRKKLVDLEQTFDLRLAEALEKERSEHHRRYSSLDQRQLGEISQDLDALLERVEKAFKLQRAADERYGLIPAIRQKLLKIELHLEEIESVYSDSLVVHVEIARVKEALLSEKKRILDLPGIGRALQREPRILLNDDLRQKVRLLDPTPGSLAKIAKAGELVSRLEDLGLLDDANTLMEDIDHKRNQIAEALYARFSAPGEPAGAHHAAQTFEEFVKTGKARQCDLYVDAYNILMRAFGDGGKMQVASLADARDDFIDAVCRKSQLFRKVFLVFDGVEDFRDRRGNVEIIYTDKGRGATADAFIIESITKRKDRQTLLVTADREIIKATENKVYALVDTYQFYVFTVGLKALRPKLSS